ncbi:MAG TPA: hypothetical protein VF704_02445 [Allosphingosinicella sp.]|jgi:hypothetical protein
MQTLTIADFRRGDTLHVRSPAGELELKLAEVHELPPSGREGGAFRLEFHGPMEPLLQQGTYDFLVGASWVGIFVVPLGFLPQAMRYEAIFY